MLSVRWLELTKEVVSLITLEKSIDLLKEAGS